MADEVGYLVVEDVEVGYWGCNLFSPHPNPLLPVLGQGHASQGQARLPWGEGTLIGGFVAALLLWIPAYAGKTVRGGFAVGVGEAEADQVLGGFEAVVDFDARGLAVQGVGEKARDVFTVFGETDDVLL